MKKSIHPLHVAVIGSTYKNVYQKIEKLLISLNYTPGKNRLFIKPNLVDAYSPSTGIITHPKFVESIIKYFINYFPGMEIVIGDSCAVHADIDKVFETSGYKALSMKYDVKLVDLEKEPRKKLKWEHGSIELPELIYTHEYINAPKMKTHCQTSVSLSLKNQKGLLKKADKQNFHRKFRLSSSIKLLSEIVRPDLNLIDGILSLEGNGPTNWGTCRKTNLIIGSKSIHAADHVAAKIMGFNPRDIEHIPNCDDFQIIGDKDARYKVPHKKPDPPPFKNMNIYFHFDQSLCSLCSIRVEDALKPKLSEIMFLLKLFFSRGLLSRKDIIAGKYDKLPQDAKNILYIGDCAIKQARKNHRAVVTGCPPSVEKIRDHYLRFCIRKHD